jgi:hypothetical protein
MKIFHGLVFVFVLFRVSFCSFSVFADPIVNAWISPSSGNWEDSQKWSLGSPPASGQTIMLTNQGWKAIAIGPNTVQNFSDTLDVSSVILGGYTDSFNLLLLNYAGFEIPLLAGSVNVGTNSGITALASVLTVSSNSSGPGDLSIFCIFNQGEQAIVNARTISLGDITNASAGAGTYNQTNGIINADEVSLANGSTFNQFDGANTVGTLWMGAANSTNNYGRYDLANGSMAAASVILYRGTFNQTGGSVAAGLGLGDGTYALSGGILNLPGITIPNVNYSLRNPSFTGMGGNAVFVQTGGTNFCNGSMQVYDTRAALINVPFWGPGSYVLSNGVLCVSNTVRSWMSRFQQWGGWHTNAGTEVAGDTRPNWEIRSGSFTLGGGTLITPSITVELGDFTQSGGTNRVSGDVGIGIGGAWSTFTLSGGLLTDLNTSVDGTDPATPGPGHAFFTQNGGTHIVTNLLRIIGPPASYRSQWDVDGYFFNGGQLTAPNIQIDNAASFNHNGGALTTSGLLTLGYATWNENTTGQQFGQLLVGAPAGSNATFSLPLSGNCVVRFANSSSVTWSNQADLLITNWKGSPNGGGNHQVYFGSSTAGLTPQQLSQVIFKNPNGASGNFPARILSTGEIVPGRVLLSQRSGNSLVLQWGSGSVLQSATNVAGPWQDVSGATSPYTVPFTGPQRFFRVRQ